MIAPPPVLYGAAMGTAYFMHWQVPLQIAEINLEMAGYGLAGVGVLLAVWAFKTMYGAGTPANPYKPAGALVTSGPFRFSRNPVYLAITLLYFGVALWLNTLWAVVLFPVLLVFMLFGVIFREERYLLLRFGGKYLKYKVAVRRWL